MTKIQEIRTVVKHKNDPLKTRIYFHTKSQHAFISPIHDIPLFNRLHSRILNMVVEIPKGSQSKMEMATKEKHNPIKQDVKNGALRFVHYPYPFNYGAFPQTWEDPKHRDVDTKKLGDGDPIDACEIGSIPCKVGDIIQVKVLGIWGMIDEGQTDWKVVCINVKDPLASKLRDIKSIDKLLPGVLDYYYRFFRDYKIPSGSKANKFAFNGKLRSSHFAYKKIKETHKHWERVMSGEREVNADELAF